MTTIEKITACRNRYEEVKEVVDSGDGVSVFGELVSIRKELSCLAYDLGVATGNSVKLKINSKNRREITQYLKQKELMEQQPKPEKVTAAEAKAKQSVTSLLQDEANMEADYKQYDIILRQTNELIFSVKQDIAIIRKERESFTND